MKNKFLVAVFAIMLTVSGLAVGGQFFGTTAHAATHGGVFTYTYNGQVYESSISEEDAWSNAMLDQLQQGNITMEDVDADYSVWGSRDIIEDITLFMPFSSGTSLTGRAEWQPNATAAYLPLQRVKVELYMHWGNFAPLKVDETYTTDNGNYTFDNFSLWEQLAIIGFGPVWTAVYQTYSVRIYPESTTFRVAKDWAGVTLLDEVQKWSLGLIPNFLAYYVSSSTGTWFWQSSGSFGTMQIPYLTTNDTHKSFYISQALVMGQRFVQDVRGVNLNMFVTAMYPFVDNEAFCFAGLMGIGGDRDGDKIGDRFDDWETVLHEYGHFVQHNVGVNAISLIDYALYNPNHSTTSDHTASTANGGKGNKSYGVRLAWTEAWATAFAMITIAHYATGYYASGQTLIAAGIQNTNGDLNYYSAFPASTYGSLANMGEGQEDAIIAFLWNLYRQPFFGQNGFWNTTTINGTYTLTDFVNVIDTYYPQYRSQIGSLMGRHKISPHSFTLINTPNFATPPTFEWQVSGSQSNPNNQFNIAFYNRFGEQVYETGNVLATTVTTVTGRSDLRVVRYTLSQSQWETALAAFPSGGNASVAVKGYHSSSPTSGPYWSAYQTVSVDHVRLIYKTVSGGVSITGASFIPSSGIVDIPATIGGQAVVAIGNSAFANQSQMSQISIPASVISIGLNAFSGCNSLILNWNNTIINIKNAEINTSYSGTLSNVNKYYWYEYVAQTTGTYIFKTTGTTDTYGELFSNMIYDNSTIGRITYNDNSGDGNNFLINHHLNTGQKVYLRVRGSNTNINGNFGFEINKEGHTHSYNIYDNYYDNFGHRMICICGDTIMEAHDTIIISGKCYCSICPWEGKNVIIRPDQFDGIFSVKYLDESKQMIINIEDKTRHAKKKE